MMVSGPVTLANVAGLLEEGRRHLAEGVRTVDFGEVTEMDSAALALCLAWLRDARAAGGALYPAKDATMTARTFAARSLPISFSAPW